MQNNNQSRQNLNEGRNVSSGNFIYGGFPKLLNEAKKSPEAKKDWDKDGKVETEKDEVFGSRMRAARQAGKMVEESTIINDQDIIENLLEELFSDEDLHLLEAAIKKKKWIKKGIKKEGSLRKAMKTKKGETIPVSKLEKAAKKGGKMGKRARLALTLKKINEETEDLSEIGIDEMHKLLSRGAHPRMAGNKPGGVPPELRKEALAHLETVKSFPQGKVEGYTTDHPIYKKAMDAHKFFKTHFPDFGVEEQIADHNSLFDQDVLARSRAV
jgi:hypothetical protein